MSAKTPYPILLLADSILGLNARSNQALYDRQAQILLNFEAGNPTAAACANFTGKTSTVFPVAALWTLYNFPRARLMYISATGAQVKNQFFASLNRFRSRPAFAGWNWLETELRTPAGGFLFGRATDTGGHIEGIHNQVDSPAKLRVGLEENVQVIPGFPIPIKNEFFIPFRLVNALGYCLENQQEERSGPLLVFANQEPYVAPEAKTTA